MKIYNEDCLDVMPSLPSNSIDLILTDPPYMISRETNFSKGGGDEAKYGSLSMDFGEWDKGDGVDMEVFFKDAYRLLKKGGTIIMFYDIFKMESIKRIAEKFGFKQPRIGFWRKTNAVPVNARINYLSNAREYFISFCKGKKGVFNSYYDKAEYDYPIVAGKERVHPTQKPYGLMRDLIMTHTKGGDIVLDPFAGSGVVGKVCKDHKRDCILIEQDEKYYNIIKGIEL
jgi:DNA modification methylase